MEATLDVSSILIGEWYIFPTNLNLSAIFLVMGRANRASTPHFLLADQEGDRYFFYPVGRQITSYNRNERPSALDSSQDLILSNEGISWMEEPFLSKDAQEKIQQIFDSAIHSNEYEDLFNPQYKCVVSLI